MFILNIGDIRLALDRIELRRPRMVPQSRYDEIRMNDGILDSAWYGEILYADSSKERFWPERLVPVLVAGKAERPDVDACRLAAEVLGMPNASFRSLHKQEIKIFSDWSLTLLWFPYQTFNRCWFMELQSDYGGTMSYAFIPRGESLADTRAFSAWGGIGDSEITPDLFVDIPKIVDGAIEFLRSSGISSDRIDGVFRRIENERLFGTELVDDLLLIFDACRSEIDTSTLKHEAYPLLRRELEAARRVIELSSS